MHEIRATAVEVYTEKGVRVVHFDDQAERYLQLQSPEADDPVEFEAGYGKVHVEIDDHLHSGFNCFSAAELHRDRFRLVLARDPAVTRFGEVVVRFEVDDAAFAELRAGLAVVFRACPGFRVTAP